ncbi:MAG: site-2 protease family protein [Candidatus Atribacteria bacterium]|nr:site-2 protease family protein [Candidatus Atribacteria bacterium]
MIIGLLGGIIFVLVFAGIILLHELGHFIVARLLNIEVEEFGIGFPPRLLRLWRGKGSILIGKERLVIPINFDLPFDHKLSIHRPVNAVAASIRSKLVLRSIDFAAAEDGQYRPDPVLEHEPSSVPSSVPPAGEDAKFKPNPLQPGEIHLSGILSEVRPGTEFTLNWIPLGGFNKIKGEDDPDAPGGMAAANPWKRIAVLLAGASMNLLTAVVVYTIFFSQIGIPDSHTTVIAIIDSPSPAEQAGLQLGDVVLAAGGLHVNSYNRLTEVTHNYLDLPLPLVILRDGKVLEITVTPRSVYPSDQGPMGVGIGQPLLPAKSWFETIPAAFSATGWDVNSLLALPGRIIAGTISPQSAQIGGPRSVWNLFQQAVARDVSSRQTTSTGGTSTKPTNYTLLTIISLTVTIAVVNLLPIPALDGGRIFMTLPEIILRRRIPAKYQNMINGIGFIILITLLGFFYIKDIISPVNFTLP